MPSNFFLPSSQPLQPQNLTQPSSIFSQLRSNHSPLTAQHSKPSSSHQNTFTFFLLALISLCFGAPTPTLLSTNVLSTVPKAEVHPRTFTSGFGLLSAIDARTVYSAPIEIKARNDNEEGEVLAERQDCGAPFCNAGTGLSAPAFSAMVMAMAVVAVGGVVMG